MERKLIQNIQAYLEPLVSEPVILFDSNEDRDLPVVVVGIEKVEVHPVLDANAVVNGFIMVGYRGTQDAAKTAELTTTAIKGFLQDTDLYSALNAPLSGTDTRPGKPFSCELLCITGTERQEEEHTTTIFINWEAYISNLN